MWAQFDIVDNLFANSHQGISTIADYAFNNSTRSVSRAALGCLANALLLTPPTRQIFVDLNYQTKACGLLKCGHADDEFLVSRVLFLTTYETNIDLVKLLTHDGLAGIICQILERHVKIRAQSTLAKKAPSVMEDMALTEVLKLQFNVMHYCPQEAKDFSPSIPSIIALFNIEPPLAANTINALVNALINLDLEREEQYHDAIFDSSSKDNFNTRLIRVLRTTLSQSAQENLDAQVAPLLTLVHKLYIIAPTETKDIYKLQLLPDKEDRKEILGQSQSLPSLLLNLTTAPLAPQARELVSDLLFELSDKDAAKFVDNIGYGFASAYLFQHKIALPENALNAAASSIDHPINPITGQRLDMETAFSGPEMTQEEKEREAERLMVLFDR